MKLAIYSHCALDTITIDGNSNEHIDNLKVGADVKVVADENYY